MKTNTETALTPAPERTGWRDIGISQRHRNWGVSAPAADLDFLLMEYDYATPKALIEYKNINGRVDFESSQIRCLKSLGDMARLPAFVTVYTTDFQRYAVCPLNDVAKEIVPLLSGSVYSAMTEYDYVKLLYRLRGKTMPSGLELYSGSYSA